MGAITTGANSWAAANALSVMVRARMIQYAQRTSRIMPRFAQETNYQGITLGMRRWPDFSDDVEDLTEGSDFTNITAANSSPTTIQATPGITGMGIEISDLLDSADPMDISAAYQRQFEGVLVEEVDDDIAALFTALNGGTAVGTSGADATLSNFIDGMVTVQSAQAAGELFSILHPRQAGDLGLHNSGFMSVATGATNVFTNTGAGAGAGTATAGLVDRLNAPNGLVGTIAGVPVIVSPRCPLVNSSADRAGCIAVPDAITTVYKWMVRPEVERHAMGVSQYLVVSSAYAVIETADNFGVPFETDA